MQVYKAVREQLLLMLLPTITFVLETITFVLEKTGFAPEMTGSLWSLRKPSHSRDIT